MSKEVDERIEVFERLARMEAKLEGIHLNQEELKERVVAVDCKVDAILNNDKDKLQRISRLEERFANLKTVLFLYLVPISAGIAKWFV